jgi:hypothetical protein
VSEIPRVAPDKVCLPGDSQQKYWTTRASTVGGEDQDQKPKHALYEARVLLWEALIIPILRSVPVIIVIIVLD